MEVGEPAETGAQLVGPNGASERGETRCIEVFQENQNLVPVGGMEEEPGDPTVVVAARRPLPIPGGFDLVRAELALVGTRGVPAARMPGPVRCQRRTKM